MIFKDSGGAEFEQAPVGSHVARCVRMIDIGTQKGEYQGNVNFKRQVILGWELPTELMTSGELSGKPFTVSKFYTASLSEKATLRKDLANWRGRDFTEQELLGFDSKNILNKGCMLSVTTNDNRKSRVSGVMALPKGITLPERINDILYFSLEPGEYDPEVFESLSEGYKKMIRLSPEWQQLQVGGHEQDSGDFSDFPSDTPF